MKVGKSLEIKGPLRNVLDIGVKFGGTFHWRIFASNIRFLPK